MNRALRWTPALCLGLAILAVTQARAINLPDDFVDTPVVGGLAEPINLCFMADGRLLVTERATARVRLIVNGAFSATDPILTVANVRSSGN